MDSGKFRLCLVVSLFCSIALMIGGCTNTGGRPLDELVMMDQAQSTYTVSAGDTLNVQVWGEPRLSGEVFVRDDGRFTMPLIDDVEAQGKTLKQLSADVTNKLSRFVPAASVSISVVQTAPVRYYLLGSFLKPGEYRSDGKITFLQAISSGGGFAPFANESVITLIRKTPQGELRYDLDYNRVVSGDEPNPQLKNGDVIAVR